MRLSVVASVSTASTKVPVFALPNGDTLSDAIIYSFFASQSNSPQIDNDDLKQIDRTGRNLVDNGTTSIGFDMLKVECYNCYMRGHFAKECRSPKDNRNKETQRRNVPVDTSTSNALVSQCYGVGSYDWSFQAGEEPTNYALMSFTSSSSSSSDNEVASCSKACTKAYATLQSHYDKLTNDLIKSQFDVISYKTGLEYVEARILVYQQNETVFEEDIKLLKLDAQLRDNALLELRKKFKKAEQERDDSESDVSMPASPVYESTTKPTQDLSYSNTPSAPIIEDWVVDSEDESEGKPMTSQKVPSFVQTFEHVKSPRPSVTTVEHPIPAANLKTDILKSRGYGNSKNRKACFVFLTRSRLVSLTTARPITTAIPHLNVTRPRPAKPVVTKLHSPKRRPINHIPSPPASFEQILDFLNASVIQYALVVNPTIYVSCIKQIWAPISIKKTNDIVRLQALIDRKKVIITEASVRQALHLDDDESVDCLPNEEIFAELARMGVGKGFSRVDTPLFEGMLVPQQVQVDIDAAEEDEDAAEPTPHTPATTSLTQQELIPLTSQVAPTPPPSPHQSPIAPP
nr:hypothetical protein [Tanacetum cinerariifolium]